MSEFWKDIYGYEGIYQVSNMGRVKSLSRKNAQGHCLQERILKPSNNRGYRMVILLKNGIKKGFLVHRLVASAFLGDSELFVNHKDENKANNCVENLEYVTAAENCNYGSRNSKIAQANHRRGKPVGYIKNGELFSFSSVAEAARVFGVSSDTSIRDCVKGKQKNAYGNHFFYLKEVI